MNKPERPEFNDENCAMLASDIVDAMDMEVLIEYAYENILAKLEAADEDSFLAQWMEWYDIDEFGNGEDDEDNDEVDEPAIEEDNEDWLK